jgi:hypothetical protein
VNALATNAHEIFAGMTAGITFSSDQGVSWVPLDSGLSFLDVSSLVFCDGVLYAGGDGVYRLADNGQYWVRVDSSIAMRNVSALCSAGKYLFVGTDDSGIFMSSDNGVSWTEENLGLGCIQIQSLYATDTVIFAGTYSGVWRRPLAEMISPSAVSEATIAASQIHSFPNPLSQSATIRFNTEESGLAEVSIVNVLGTEVTRIFSGELNQGQHSFIWDAQKMTPGMYECIVRMNGHVNRVSMMLAR